MPKRRRVRTVLVVDDDRELLAVMPSLMPEHTVHIVAEVEAVIDRVRAVRPDLVIIDLWLDRDICGDSLVEDIRATTADVRVALVSAGMDVRLACIVAKHSAADVVDAKPFDRSGFAALIGRIESEERPRILRPRDTPSFAEVRQEHARRVLALSNGNKSEAARRLGVYRSTLVRVLERSDEGAGEAGPAGE